MNKGEKKKERPPVRQYTRRQAVSKIAGTTVAATAAVGLGVGLYSKDPRRSQVELKPIRDHRVERQAGALEMAIARGPDPGQNTRQALEAMGGMSAFVRSGETVVVKPNVGWNRMPEQAANTNPDVVAEVVRQVKAAGASKIIVCDVSVNDAERCFARSGIAKAAQEAGAELVLPDPSGFRQVSVGGVLLKAAEVLWPFVEADRIINLPLVKQHGLSQATLAMKNWYGVIGGHRVRLHQDIHRSIVDLAAMVKPTLTVLDGTRILRANGPSGGSLDDVDRGDTIAVAVDEVALDAFGCSLLNLDPAEIGFVVEAEQRGLGKRDYKSLKIEEINT